ncbi:MAG: SCO family protein [Saprospiraceae bacterium]|uniref:SCO family protein n=1 Tax=Candidatus Defluviibacterium haderslevense TaxID=2981993 RepID=A0A9D7XG92_9BACT|nr:SCO family protein [Candidatus Defluviibacterium haderslevense]
MKMYSSNLNKEEIFTFNSTEEEVGNFIDKVRSGELPRSLLIDFLSERHPVFVERPNYQMNRIRGYVMASFLKLGLPDSALTFVLDELQNGKHAYLVGAAAQGLRGYNQQRPQFVGFLLQALSNIRYHDDSINLDVFKPSWPLEHPTTAKREIFLTFQWLKGYAISAIPELRSFLNNPYDFDAETSQEIQKAIESIESDNRKLDLSCCELEYKEDLNFSWCKLKRRNIKSIGHLEVENQEGMVQPLKEFIGQKTTVIAFFYTRCMNPNKCTLTINKLGWLEKEIFKSKLQENVNLLAFTYDPNYDTAAIMLTFGENRGMNFGPNVHMLRTVTKEFSLLSDFFELGVNYVSSTINQHRLELFLVDARGNIKTTYTRLQWEVDMVQEDIMRLLKNSNRFDKLSRTLNSVHQVVFPLVLAFFPKCPVCWGVYLSAFGITSLKSIPYSPWLIPWIIIAILINLIILLGRAKARNGLIPFWISLVGAILLIIPGYVFSIKLYSTLGILLIICGALLNSLSFKNWLKLKNLTNGIFCLGKITFLKLKVVSSTNER